jgi:class 3 adenylate cyclase
MAQRMESVAPPGGVMLPASTAWLVDGIAPLGEPQMVEIKGADEPVLAVACIQHQPSARTCWAA